MSMVHIFHSYVTLPEGKYVTSSRWFLLTLLWNGCDGQQIHPAALQRAVEQLTPKDEIAARPRKPEVVDGPLGTGQLGKSTGNLLESTGNLLGIH